MVKEEKELMAKTKKKKKIFLGFIRMFQELHQNLKVINKSELQIVMSIILQRIFQSGHYLGQVLLLLPGRFFGLKKKMKRKKHGQG